LKNCAKRLDDIKPRQVDSQVTLTDILRMMARQSYHVAAQLFKEKGTLPIDQSSEAVEIGDLLTSNIRMQAHLYKNLQLYDYAAAILNAYGMSPETVERVERKISGFHEQHRSVIPLYYREDIVNENEVSGSDGGNTAKNLA
jgi:hypothetical protein